MDPSASIAFGVSWNDSKKGRRLLTPALFVLSVSLLAPMVRGADDAGERFVSVIVRGRSGAGAERAVVRSGGRVTARLGIIDGLAADVPEGALRSLAGTPGILSMTPNAGIRLSHATDGFDPATDAGSLHNTAKWIKAQDLWRTGITGQGVDVALIDSGVAPVNGLTAPGKVVNGPDLSFESQADNLRYLDTFGHGTHMAGIIAARDGGVSPTTYDNHDNVVGIAPDARVVSVKVANAQGAADVSQVIAAIDWVVQHRTSGGLSIRVLNLSFGTDGTQDYTLDPLAYAAEVAWRKGIVVVVAAGNSGYGTPKLNNPAYDPFVIAVGANDPKGTVETYDDVVPEWSSRGDGTRNPDLVAPGKSIVSLRNPGSHIDLSHPEGAVNARFFRGSGTSQAAAVVSGAAALLLQQRPDLTPDQVKALLVSTASPLPAADPVAQGAGEINVKNASRAPTPAAAQAWPVSAGTGSLEPARGTAHVVDPSGTVLSGEQDIFAAAWDGNSWSGNSWSGNSWSGGTWNGNSWSGNSWSGNSWSGNSWSAVVWSGNSWSGNSWSAGGWSGNSWSGNSWSGNSWSGNSWSGNSWSGNSWSGNSWSASVWS